MTDRPLTTRCNRCVDGQIMGVERRAVGPETWTVKSWSETCEHCDGQGFIDWCPGCDATVGECMREGPWETNCVSAGQSSEGRPGRVRPAACSEGDGSDRCAGMGLVPAVRLGPDDK